MSGKRIILSVLLILCFLYIYFFYNENLKKEELIHHTFERFSFSPPERTPYGGFIIRNMKNFRQSEDNTCGPAAARYFLTLSGIHVTEDILSESMKTDNIRGTDFKSIKDILKKYGVMLKGVKGDSSILKKPCIIQLEFGHFVVFLKKSNYDDNFFIFDPNFGEVFLFNDDFYAQWSGYALIQ